MTVVVDAFLIETETADEVDDKDLCPGLLGWVEKRFRKIPRHPGKLVHPTCLVEVWLEMILTDHNSLFQLTS